MPLFSIIVPTRDRAELCINALRSIQAQSFDDVEVVIVDDGSSPNHAEKLSAFKGSLYGDPKQWVWHHLPRHQNGHGVAFVRNLGVSLSTGAYIGMLDDDDIWIDNTYLKKVSEQIMTSNGAADLFFSNQKAMQGGTLKPGPIWIEPLENVLTARGEKRTDNGFYAVTLADLLQVNGFCHLNTTITKREVFDASGGFDPCLRYESDRDLYLNLIDHADVILHLPDYVARHHIPDAAKGSNVSTRVTQLQKRLFQVRILQKAALNSQHSLLRHHARLELSTVYKHICAIAKAEGDNKSAALFARQALACRFTIKWAAYTAALTLKAATSRG